MMRYNSIFYIKVDHVVTENHSSHSQEMLSSAPRQIHAFIRRAEHRAVDKHIHARKILFTAAEHACRLVMCLRMQLQLQVSI